MKRIVLPLFALLFMVACNQQQDDLITELNSNTEKGKKLFSFYPIGELNIGGTGAAEISAFDMQTNKLFVVNNTIDDDDNVLVNQVDVVDFSVPELPQKLHVISISPYGGKVNSVAVKDGLLAAAIESDNKTQNGKIVVFSTDTYQEIAVVEVGALPDMVTFTPNGNYILSANEGEPNSTYTIDPLGTVSIIDVQNSFDVVTLDFSIFETEAEALKAKGLRVFGKGASFASDMEPEYIAVGANSKKAWVSLQENNALAVIDVEGKSILEILPLGFKDYSLSKNSIDPSNRDDKVEFGTWPVYGMYQPDAIAVLPSRNVPFVFTANEGDARDYNGFSEEERIKDVDLDPTAFPNAEWLQVNENLGRLNMTTTLGDTDNDGDYDELYSYGARSFSIWNGNSGKQMYDSGDFLDKTAYAQGDYDDGRSDDKGSEPEGMVIGRIQNRDILFIGMERVDAIAVYDVTNPVKPAFLQWFKTGDAPEGLLFISADDSPNGQDLLVVSSEGDGNISVYGMD